MGLSYLLFAALELKWDIMSWVKTFSTFVWGGVFFFFFFVRFSWINLILTEVKKKSPVMSERVPYLTVTSQEVPYSLSNFTGSIRKGNCWASFGLEPMGRKWPHASMYYDFTRWLTAGGYFVMEEGHYSINRPVYYCQSLIYMLTKLKWPGCLKLLFAKEWLGFFCCSMYSVWMWRKSLLYSDHEVCVCEVSHFVFNF